MRRPPAIPGVPWRRLRSWALWLAILGALTAAMVLVRERLGAAHVVIAYLLVVLGGSAAGERALGLLLAALAFFGFDYFFVPPYDTLAVADPLDWMVLGAFLVTSLVATQLLYRARAEADAARRRAEEIDRLAALGAETLNVGRAVDALVAIARVIERTLEVDRCDILLRDAATDALTTAATAAPTTGTIARARSGAHGLPAWVATHGQVAIERLDGTMRVFAQASIAGDAPLAEDMAGARALVLPLMVRERVVGVLEVAREAGLALTPAQQRFLRALAYYAALGVERVRLVAEAEHAEALREAARLKDAMLASVSHDLRTPLTTIKVLAHGLATEHTPSDAVRAATIEHEADRLNAFVADLLDLSRLDAGALPLDVALNTAEDLIGATLQRTAGALDGHELRVALDREAPVLTGWFDFAHALRILTNLIDNAVKYTPRGTVIELGAHRTGDELRFTVADRGPGIAPGDRALIFEPFHRLASVAPDAGGAGIGLTIARRLAEEQHGTLRYEPRAGGGSVFVLSLPAAEPGGAGHG